jgi:hypothetical protein
MSAVSSLGRPHAHRMSPAARATTSVSSSTLSGSVTGSGQALGLEPDAGLSDGVMKQIEQAVTSELQSSKPTDDPHKVIQNAILSVLKKNGKGFGRGADAGADTTDADGTHRTFNQTLQAYGISPQQFRAQLLAAVHQTGATRSTVSSFPPGIVLDTAA